MAYQKARKKTYKEKKNRPFAVKRGVAAARATPYEIPTRMRRVSPAPALLTVVNGQPIDVGWANVDALKKPCKTAARSGDWRGCKPELMWVGPEAARLFERRKGIKLATGPTLRLCTKPNQPGVMIPVSSPAEAKALSQQYCACVQKKSGNCPAPKGAQLGGLRRGAARLSLMQQLAR